MQLLIAVEDVELNTDIFKIADVTMPERELELIQDMERPQEEEPPPETMPPEFDMTPPADLDNSTARPNLSFKGKKAGVFADGSYVPIFQVPPVYPRRAQEREIEGCVMLQFTVTKVGSTRDPEVLWSIPSGIFDRSAMRSALKYKYKPQIRDGQATEVPNVKTIVIFKMDAPGKNMDYTPEGCD
jgi:protein TonB